MFHRDTTTISGWLEQFRYCYIVNKHDTITEQNSTLILPSLTTHTIVTMARIVELS